MSSKYIQRSEESIGSSGAGVSNSCKPLKVGAGNQTRVLSQSSMCL